MHKTFLENRLVVSRSYRWVGDVCAYQGRMEDMSSEILPRWEQSSVSPMVAVTGTYTALLPGGSHGRRSLVGFSPWGLEESDRIEWLHFYLSLSCIGEGNGNPLQCSCLENPRDRGAWWAAVYGVAQSQTRLKWLSTHVTRRKQWHPTAVLLPGNSHGWRSLVCCSPWGCK